MSYFLRTNPPDTAEGQLKETYHMIETIFQMVPNLWIAQSIRPDLLEPLVTYVERLLIETHALSRGTKELIAAHVSKINLCQY